MSVKVEDYNGVFGWFTDQTFSDWLHSIQKDAVDLVLKTPLEKLQDFLISTIPNGVGYAMIAGAAMMSLNGMIGRGMMGPIGFLSGVFILGVSVLVVN